MRNFGLRTSDYGLRTPSPPELLLNKLRTSDSNLRTQYPESELPGFLVIGTYIPRYKSLIELALT